MRYPELDDRNRFKMLLECKKKNNVKSFNKVQKVNLNTHAHTYRFLNERVMIIHWKGKLKMENK